MKKIIVFVWFLFISCTVYSQNLHFDWANKIVGQGNNDVFKIIVDDTQNAYFIGQSTGTAYFSTNQSQDTLNTSSTHNLIVGKLDSSGNPMWINTIESNFFNEISDIAIDSLNNVYITGDFEGTLDFDPGPGVFNMSSPIGAFDNDVFVCKFDPAGQFLWAKQLGGTSVEEVESIAVDQYGNCILFGLFMGTADFDPGTSSYPITSNGDRDLFLCKLDANGDFLWAKTFGGTSTEEAQAFTLDHQGNIYTAGVFRSTVDFDPDTTSYSLTAGNFGDGYINKLDSDGNLLWVKQFFYDFALDFSDLHADNQNNILVAGLFNGSANFDLDTSSSSPYVLTANEYNGFLGKYTPNGERVWAYFLNSSKFNNIVSIYTDKNENIYTTGEFEGTVGFDFGPGTFNLSSPDVSSIVDADIFLQKLDKNGNFLWASDIGKHSSAYERISGIDIDKAGSIYLLGQFADTIDIDFSNAVFNLIPLSTTVRSGFLLKTSQCMATASVSPTQLTADQPNYSYQWLDCDNNYATIGGAINQSYSSPSSSGNYAVMITNNWCVDTSECYSLNIVNVEQVPIMNPIQAYPNPVLVHQNHITIQLGDIPQSTTTIRVFDLQGRLM